MITDETVKLRILELEKELEKQITHANVTIAAYQATISELKRLINEVVKPVEYVETVKDA